MRGKPKQGGVDTRVRGRGARVGAYRFSSIVQAQHQHIAFLLGRQMLVQAAKQAELLRASGKGQCGEEARRGVRHSGAGARVTGYGEQKNSLADELTMADGVR